MTHRARQNIRLPAYLTRGLVILLFIATLFTMGLGCGQAAAQTTASTPPCHSSTGLIVCVKICMTTLAPSAFAPAVPMPTHRILWQRTSIAFLETNLRPDVPPPRL